jgi:steroid delta-isomerase-like uncharacterized protein
MDRRTLMAGLLAGATGSAPMIVARADSPPAGRLAEQFAATLSRHDIDAFAALYSDAYVNHQTSAAAPAPAAGVTPKLGTVAFFAGRLKGLPDLNVEIEAMVAGADKVAASFVYTGTHQGVYLGVPPTGRKLRFTSCDILAVKDGLIVEHWGMGDIAGILAQMKG